MPQDLTIHDYADFETKARAEGIPRPTLHWLKDGKQLKLDDANFKVDFGTASDVQVTSDFAIAHFGKDYEGNVRFWLQGNFRRHFMFDRMYENWTYHF